MRKLFLITGVAALACGAFANDLLNGGFENGDVAFGIASTPWATQYNYASSNNNDSNDTTSIWHGGDLRVMSLANNGATGHAFWDSVGPSSGDYFLAVNGATENDPLPFVLTQDFANAGAGTEMSVSFDSVNLYSPGGITGITSFEVFLDGISLGTTSTQADNTWRTVTFSGFTGNGATSQFMLVSNTLQSTGNDFGIDNISASAVPEPATLAVVGVGIVGVLRRRRKV
jgi:hypothetical protein